MSTEQTMDFIDEYRSHTVLWNVSDEDYTNKIKRNEAYNILSTNFGLTVTGVKNKIKSLRSYFSKEHQKITAKKSSSGAESSWFAYRAMLFILDSATDRTGTSEDNSEFDTENPWEKEEHIEVSIYIYVLISCAITDTPIKSILFSLGRRKACRVLINALQHQKRL